MSPVRRTPTRSAGLLAWGLASLVFAPLLACSGTTVRRTEVKQRDYPAGVTSMLWRTTIHEHGLFEPRPEECASGVVVGGKLIIGSRAGTVVALDLDDGSVSWSTKVSGGVDAEATYDKSHDQVYVGTDDGHVYALDPATGKIRWRYKGQGSIERRPALGGDAVYLTSSDDRVMALDPRTGKLTWSYDREAPEGFTIHGHSGPLLYQGVVYAGFSDGYLVALNAGTGDVVWARSLATASEQYVDVDATPTVLADGTLLASSYSGGLYALGADTGDIRWRLGIEGASSVRVIGERLYFSSPRTGLSALTMKGDAEWRQAMADSGTLTEPQAVGPFLVFAGTRNGLFVVDRRSGRLLETFDPGRGMCGLPTVGPDGRTVYALANSGSVYALRFLY